MTEQLLYRNKVKNGGDKLLEFYTWKCFRILILNSSLNKANDSPTHFSNECKYWHARQDVQKHRGTETTIKTCSM